MSKVIIYGVFGAIGTGVVVGLQAVIGSRTGFVIGPVRTGMWMYILGGPLQYLRQLWWRILYINMMNTA